MRRESKIIIVCIGVLISSSMLSVHASSEQLLRIVDEALAFSQKQSVSMYETMKNKPHLLPRSAKDGELITCDSGWWTSGFFPGTLWYLYENSSDSFLLNAAEEMTSRIEKQKYNKDNHDVGFMINCSFGNGYRLTGKEDYRKVILESAHSLSTRFDSVVGCTRSWKRKEWPFAVIIDNMMNLELLTVASSYAGNNLYFDMAKSHADKTMQNHFRSDGSSYHVISYDEQTGAAIKKVTHQGANNESAWSRGQAWGLYGFTMMYRQTHKKEYLEQAIKIGNFIMNHPNLPKDKIPYWDFDAPGIPNADRDASAGAIMASAFIELSTYVTGKQSADFYNIAIQQIKSLASGKYRASKVGDNNNFILKHSTGFMRSNYEIDAPLTYADYYFVESLIRCKRLLNKKNVVDVITVYSENEDRALWLSAMDRIIKPVLVNMSNEKLKMNIPGTNRKEYTCLEALGRVIAGISPWLELKPDSTIEGQLRSKYIELSVRAISNGVNPDSYDYLNFNTGRQPLVDAAFLAYGLLRAKTQLWGNFDNITRERIIKELKSTRTLKASNNNWLLFSAMIEVALKEFTGECEYNRIEHAIKSFQKWYKGDGWYGDGENFHFDYYNSYVIHPMLMEILTVMRGHGLTDEDFYVKEQQRYTRYAAHLEHLISPEGAYPVIGRSIAYRFGAFHALSDATFRKMLPHTITYPQVRSALSAVIARQINAENTFDDYGWLRIGFAGYQPKLGEGYISTGSLYLCSTVFAALGLSSNEVFWSASGEDWTAKKAWGGENIEADKALSDKK
jgi:rhamnogalacturonyl hydrolase YesR